MVDHSWHCVPFYAISLILCHTWSELVILWQTWPKMAQIIKYDNLYSEVRPIIIIFHTLQSILIHYVKVCYNWQRISDDDNEWQTLHNMALICLVLSVLVNSDQVWSIISSMNDLVHIKAELRNLGLTYQVMACMAHWDKIGQIWSNVAYNGPIFVIVSRYDRLGSYLSLYFLLWAILALSVRIDHMAIKVPGKRESGQK